MWLFVIDWHLTLTVLVVLAAFGGGMGYAFKTLRPLFRDRGKITADLTGRLNQALGGVRVVKIYTAERREDLVFTKGAHKLLRNVAKSMTGVSALSSFSSVVVGAIGVVIIIVGGRAIAGGTMTSGELAQYVIFTGLTAMPIVQIASIGTQITEAFAGLDRIHELLSTAPGGRRRPCQAGRRRHRGQHRVRARLVRVQARAFRCSRTSVSGRPPARRRRSSGRRDRARAR